MPLADQYVSVKLNGRVTTQHVVVAESVLGHALPKGVEVHHVDGDRHNNDNHNLVVCQNRAYHHLLHRRARALAATGDVHSRVCYICHQWDTVAALTIVHRRGRRSGEEVVYHRACARRSKERRVGHVDTSVFGCPAVATNSPN